MSDDMPAQPSTMQLPQVPEWAIELTRSVKSGFITVEKRLDAQDTKLDKAVTEGIEANVRLDRVEVRMAKAEGRLDIFEERAGRTSVGVRGLSQVDLEHESKLGLVMAELAEEKAKREALEKNGATKHDISAALEDVTKAQTKAILGAVDAIAQKPLVKRLTSAALPVVLLGLAVMAYRLNAELTRLQSPPQQQSTVVNMAGPAPVDAGADR